MLGTRTSSSALMLSISPDSSRFALSADGDVRAPSTASQPPKLTGKPLSDDS